MYQFEQKIKVRLFNQKHVSLLFTSNQKEKQLTRRLTQTYYGIYKLLVSPTHNK